MRTCDHAVDFFTSPEGRNRMTPEQRLDRAERIIIMMAKAGRRARSEWREKVNILINAQIETEDQIRNLAAGHTMLQEGQTKLQEGHAMFQEGQRTLQKEMAELAKSQRLTAQALREYIQRQERNGKRSN
jgi:hypothetical protein